MNSTAKVSPVIRSFHWAIAAIVILNGLVLPAGDLAHRLLGLTAAALVVSRVLLMFRYRSDYFNPAAVYVYRAMWVAIFGLGVIGWMTRLDAFWGDNTLKQVHAVIAYLLLGLAAVHLAGISLDALRNRRKTWMKMITG